MRSHLEERDDVIYRRVLDSSLLSFRISQFLKLFAGNPITKKNIFSLLSMLHPGSSVLIIGGATVGDSISHLYAAASSSKLSIVSVDMYITDQVDVLADAHYLPFESGSFDAVIIQAVLEHVISPSVVVNEITRVLAPSGLVYSESPFLQSVHEGPYDFFRFTLSAHRWLFREYTEIHSGVLQGAFESILFILTTTLSSFIPKFLTSSTYYLLLPLIRFIDNLLPGKCRLNNASATFFLGSKSDQPLKALSIINYYNLSST